MENHIGDLVRVEGFMKNTKVTECYTDFKGECCGSCLKIFEITLLERFRYFSDFLLREFSFTVKSVSDLGVVMRIKFSP